MKRKIELLEIKLIAKTKTTNSDDFELKEFLEFSILNDILDYHYNKEKGEKREIKSRNIAFIIETVDTLDQNLKFIKTNYLKYNKATQVVDTNFVPAFKKNKNQGDLDNQHYVFSVLGNTNTCIIAFEYIMGAISKSMLQYEYNRSYKSYIKNNYATKETKELRDKLLNYEIKINYLPCTEFLAELNSLKKISLLKLDVGRKYITLDEDINYGDENASKDSVIIEYKPIKRDGFSKTKVLKYLEQVNKDKVNRILISGIKEGSTIQLDMDKVKYNKYIDVEEDIDGLVDSSDIKEKLSNILNEAICVYNPAIAIGLDDVEE